MCHDRPLKYKVKFRNTTYTLATVDQSLVIFGELLNFGCNLHMITQFTYYI